MTYAPFIVCMIALPVLAFALGYDRGRTAAELAARREGESRAKPHEKQPTYRTAGKVEKSRVVEMGAFEIKPPPELFKRSCTRCGSRFAYRLEDTRHSNSYPKINCPRCGNEEIHIA